MKKNYTIVFAVITALIALCAFWGCDSSGDDDDGSSSVSNTIGSAADLAKIGTPGYPLNGNYELTGDITLPAGWTPIGSGTAPFTGTFDGKGHSITITSFPSAGVDISSVWQEVYDLSLILFDSSVGGGSTSGNTAWALFACVRNAVIKDMNITVNPDSPFVIPPAPGRIQFFGTVAAYAINTAFTNINISGGELNVNATSVDIYCMGGIAGAMQDSSMTGCTVDVKISASLGNTPSVIGGVTGSMFGYQESIITGCSVREDVVAFGGDDRTITGGLVGCNSEGGTIRNSSVSGNISIEAAQGKAHAGGLVGRHKGIIENCFVTGDVDAESTDDESVEAGGLAGDMDGGSSAASRVEIRTSYSAGTVSAVASGTEDAHAGGIVGETHEFVGITDCYSLGDVSATGSDGVTVGGIAGNLKLEAITEPCYEIERCYASGTISAKGSSSNKRAGGIAGNAAVQGGGTGSITACAVLSGSVSCISGSGTAKRVLGDGSPSLSNNSANTAISGSPNADGPDGRNISVPASQSDFETTLGWGDFTDSVVWKWKTDESRPVLKWQ
jgi:hypothetical protein